MDRKDDSFVGSYRYCSRNVVKGHLGSRRDDCESIFYMLVEFANGDLPWSKKMNGPDTIKVLKKIKLEMDE